MDQRLLVFAVVIVPVLSVCLGFTVHYAIRPLVEMLLDAIHDLGRIAGGPAPDRVARLEAEIDALRSEVKRLRASTAVDPVLQEQSSDPERLPPGAV